MRLMFAPGPVAVSVFAGGLLLAGCAWGQATAPISQGQRVAQRSCGGCHAVADGPSPLADAPPFRDLHRRYPAGGLKQLLDEGMLPSTRPLEEGSRPGHPRMPEAKLDLDEVAALTAYLRGLEPGR